MSKDCSSNISHHFQELLIADLFSFFSFIVSKPLYFAYLLFFLPYIVQFISFLCPILLSSSLLFLLSLLTISPHEKLTRYGFLGNACRKVVNALETQPDDNVEFHFFDPLSLIASELEACISLETVSYRGVGDDPVVEDLVEDGQTPSYNARKELVGIPQENDELGAPERLDNLWGEHEPGSVASRGLSNNFGENPIKVPLENDELEASEQDQELKIPSIGSLGCNKRSMVAQGLTCNVGETANEIPQLKDELGAYEHQELKTTQGVTFKVAENHVQDIDTSGKENCNVMSLNPVGFGSMRKEKEWKRTLACKLYEERQSMESSEGMDLLWEVYEVDSGKAKEINKGKKEKMLKKKDYDMYEEEEEEEEEMNSQLCCLQALRFSTGRMNVGLGKLNSMRITKAFKGMGIFVRREKKKF
eukprot:TRINITY_DN14116_c0_g1_i1.p1 TRINITY_DN14116_c0_g1~~TRINITY_DN14116_c0_g1_i1.p1  ORF type:complete len:418 (-),score=101.74 TRINITY_DN14116_c0_g1_i1:313-1566(-)